MTKLSQGERIVLVAGLLLIVDLLFLPWHSVDLGVLDVARELRGEVESEDVLVEAHEHAMSVTVVQNRWSP